MRFLQNTLVPMRDGVRIAADVYLPDGDGRYPAIFYFGPYRKDDWILTHGSIAGLPELCTDRGYALVVADVRGTNDSEGTARVMFDLPEQEDGAEMVEWIAAQPWCDGNVGMTGVSYGFLTSILTAPQQPPHLRTIVPIEGGVSWYYCINEDGLPMSFGYHANYAALMIAIQGAPPGYRDAEGRWREVWKHRLENYTPWGLEWFGCQADDEYWQPASIASMYDRLKVPVFVIDGWWDRYSSDPLKLAEGIQGPTKILLGPWQHMRPDFGIPGPRVDYDIVMRWFDYWLKGEDNGIMNEPRLTYYAQRYGPPAEYRNVVSGVWRQAEQWPIEDATLQRHYLHSAGSLSADSPPDEGAREYRYDPTIGGCSNLDGGIYGGIGMPVDQRPDEAGSLLYTTAPLEKEVEATGIAKVRLHFSSTAKVMGVFAKLCDVAPDGTVALVTRGQLNACHRNGLDRPEYLTPGEVYALDIEMKATSYVFEPGHRIRLAVTSAEFPTVFPTPEAGTNRIHCGPAQVSYLDLPVVPAASEPAPLHSIKEVPPAPEERPAENVFEVGKDPATGEATALLDTHARFRSVEAWVDFRHRTHTRVHPDRPAEAVLESTCIYGLEYDSGEKIESKGEIRCTGDAKAIQVDAKLRVTVDGKEECSKTWKATHPRGFF